MSAEAYDVTYGEHVVSTKRNMVYCIAFGCSNDSRYSKNISYHRLPRDEKQRKVWLTKISRENPTISQNSVVCSEHFEPDCFERDMKAELLGSKPKAWLKPEAVPSIFSHRPPAKKRRTSSEKRLKEKEKKEVIYFLSINKRQSRVFQ